MTEQEANKLLEIIGEPLVKIYGINFVAVRKDEFDDHFIQVGYNSEKTQFSDTIQSDISHVLAKNPIINTCLNEHQKSLLSGFTNDILASAIDTESDFSFHNRIPRPGDKIERQGSRAQPGTLGIFVTMKNRQGIYFISNYHVVMGNYIKLGKKIIHSVTRKEIGTLFWGIYNEFYDIAIVKLNNNITPNSESQCFKFSGNIGEPEISTPVEISGAMSVCANENDDKQILSRNAYVALDNNRVFKNQILTSKISIKGDSGSFMVNSNNYDALGILIGGDEKNYSVCNYLHPLFNCKISPLPYQYQEEETKNIITGLLPEFEIKSIYTN